MKFFTESDKSKIESTIAEAELLTSGEIRVHIEKKCKENVLDHAAFIFEKLEMHKTDLRNGILIYLAYEDRKLAIIGDVGINQKVTVDFWEETKELMLGYFKQNEFTLGFCKGILNAGKQLKMHFPYEKGDKNELSNEISFGK